MQCGYVDVGVRRDPNHLTPLLVFSARFHNQSQHVAFLDAAFASLLAGEGLQACHCFSRILRSTSSASTSLTVRS
jgi:hypothetical protein